MLIFLTGLRKGFSIRWKGGRLLNPAGKEVLIKVIIQEIPSYVMCIVSFLKTFCKQLCASVPYVCVWGSPREGVLEINSYASFPPHTGRVYGGFSIRDHIGKLFARDTLKGAVVDVISTEAIILWKALSYADNLGIEHIITEAGTLCHLAGPDLLLAPSWVALNPIVMRCSLCVECEFLLGHGLVWLCLVSV